MSRTSAPCWPEKHTRVSKRGACSRSAATTGASFSASGRVPTTTRSGPRRPSDSRLLLVLALFFERGAVALLEFDSGPARAEVVPADLRRGLRGGDAHGRVLRVRPHARQ